MADQTILVTCPPMLGSIEDFRALFTDRGVALVCPQVVQTLSVGELKQIVPGVDGWIAGDDPVNREVLQAGLSGRLRAVVKWGVGVDNVDFAAARDLGLPIANTPGMFGAEVADVAMSYVAALARETFSIDRHVRKGKWPKPRGISLAEKTVALVGLGDIGRATARRLIAADMQVIAYDPGPSASADPNGVQRSVWPARLEEADFVVFTCALTPHNRGMFGPSEIARAKPGLRVVNVARGPLIQEQALIAALRSEQIHSAALDVFEVEPLPIDSPLRNFDRCILGSHNASNTTDAVIRTSLKAIELLFSMLNPS